MNKNYLVSLFGLIFVLSAFFGRFFNTSLWFSDSYTYFMFVSDSKSYFEFFISLIGISYLPFVLFFVSVLNLFLLVYLLRFLGLDDVKSSLFLLLFVLSPFFVYSHTNFSLVPFLLLLFLLSLRFFVSKSVWFYFFVGLTSLVSIPFFLFLVFGYYFYGLLKENSYFNKVLFLLPLVFIEGFDFFSGLVVKDFLFSSLFVEFGYYGGLSFIFFIIGFLGVFTFWVRDSDNIFYLVVSVVSLLLGVYFVELLLFSVLYLSYTGMLFVLYLIDKSWYIKDLKFYTLILVVCSYLFVMIIFLNGVITVDDNKLDALNFLSSVNSGEGVVFSSFENHDLIVGLTGRDVFSNNPVLIFNADKERVEDFEILISSFRYGEVLDIVNKYDLKYFFIDVSMLNGNYFRSRQDGLLFVLFNNNNFELIFDDGEVFIFEFLS